MPRRSGAIVYKFALLFSAWVVAGYILTRGENVRGIGVSLAGVLLWYGFAAFSIIAVIRLLGSWATTRTRGAVVGFVATIPLSLSVNFTMVEGPILGIRLLGYVMMMGVFLGAPVGAMYWRAPD